MSEKSIVNDTIRQTPSEDEVDLEAFESRRGEPSVDFEDVVESLRRTGKI